MSGNYDDEEGAAKQGILGSRQVRLEGANCSSALRAFASPAHFTSTHFPLRIDRPTSHTLAYPPA